MVSSKFGFLAILSTWALSFTFIFQLFSGAACASKIQDLVADTDLSLSNSFVSISFDPQTFIVTQIYQKVLIQGNTVLIPTLNQTYSVPAFWALDVIIGNSTGTVGLNNFSPCGSKSFSSPDSQTILFSFKSCTTSDIKTDINLVDVLIQVNLPLDSQVATSSFSVIPLVSNIALWTWSLSLNGIISTSLLENYGFGILHICPCPSFSHDYPDATMQYMGSFQNQNINDQTINSALYIATHDATAASKYFITNKITDNSNGDSIVNWQIQAQPPNAGRLATAGVTIVLTDNFVFGALLGDWWDVSQIYKKWALPSAAWTQQGPLSQRNDLPSYLFDLPIWVNSHWQQNDIFNTSGGDPYVVTQRVSAIAKRFGRNKENGGIGLHWYEPDLLGYAYGSNYTICNHSTGHCGFDTNYPDYTGMREGFSEALSTLQGLGVRVHPYINGRIWDESTSTWSTLGKAAAAKSSQPVINPTLDNLGLYEEQYGSLAQFAVTCPDTDTWKTILHDTVAYLVKEQKVDGVYIDQIAAAGPRNCFDPTHNHSAGGGSSWVDGYRTLLQSVRQAVGTNPVLLTEANAEPFMDSINIYLTLTSFYNDFAAKKGGSMMVPAFSSIYGGYYVGMGSIFFEQDLTAGPDVFAAKIAQQFIYGVQLGWMSLGGRDNNSPFMGMFDALMSPTYDNEINYLRILIDEKVKINKWLQFGTSTRLVPWTWNGSKLNKHSNYIIHNPKAYLHNGLRNNHKQQNNGLRLGLNYNPVFIGSYIEEKGLSWLITVTTATTFSGNVTITLGPLNVNSFVYDDLWKSYAHVNILDFDENVSLGTFDSSNFSFQFQTQSRQVKSFVITPVA